MYVILKDKDFARRDKTMRNKLFIKLTALALSLTVMLSLSACSEEEPLSKQVFAMDTVMTVTAYGSNAEAGVDAAAGVIKAMDSMLDPESEDSYTWAINNAGGGNVVVTPQIAEMLSTAYTVYERSGGALDLSVYPIYLAWGEFKEETGRVPSSDELTELRKKLGFGKMELMSFPGEENYSVRLPDGTQISFGAVAKGCAANYAIGAMRDAGVESGIVSLGGNVQTLGLKPDGSNWTIAVEDPADTGSYLGTLSVGETAVVTSGDYQRYFKAPDGTVYHHLIDPSTGKPTENTLSSVTIVCTDGTMADALSTAMFVLGENAALKYWQQYGGFEMIMVTKDNRVLCTSGLMESFALTNSDDYTISIVG